MRRRAIPQKISTLLIFVLLPAHVWAAGFKASPTPQTPKAAPPAPKFIFPLIPSKAPGTVGWDGKTGVPSGTNPSGDATATNSYSTAIPAAGTAAATATAATSPISTSTKTGVAATAPASTGGVSDAAKAGFDESRKSTDAVATVDTPAGGDKKGPGPGAPGDQSKIEQFPYIWPMCIFSAQGTKNANGVTDQLIKMAAKCKVQLMVFPMFVKSTRGNGAKVAAAASAKCNADIGLQRFGVNRATALVITDDENQPAQFCGVSGVDPKDKRGCAQSTFDVGYGVTTRVANTEGLPPKASNKIAAAIVYKGATIQDFAYWTQGWGQVGRPPGPGGNRIGESSMGYSDARSEKVGWDDEFCSDMRKNSFKNPGIKYDPKHDRWMKEPDDKNKLVDLFDKQPLWRQPNAAPKPGKSLDAPTGGQDLASSGGPQAPSDGGGGAPSGGGRNSGSRVDTAPLNSTNGAPPGGETVLGNITAGGGHKIAGQRPNGRDSGVRTISDGGQTALLAGVSTPGGGGDNVISVDRKPGATGSGMGGGGQSVRIDETMTASGAVSTVGNGGASVLNGGITPLISSGSGKGTGTSGGAAGSLPSMDSSFFSKLNFIPIEGIRARIPLLKNNDGVTSAREKATRGLASVPAAGDSLPRVSPTQTPAASGDNSSVVSRRTQIQ